MGGERRGEHLYTREVSEFECQRLHQSSQIASQNEENPPPVPFSVGHRRVCQEAICRASHEFGWKNCDL